jgi:hypothetical protein
MGGKQAKCPIQYRFPPIPNTHKFTLNLIKQTAISILKPCLQYLRKWYFPYVRISRENHWGAGGIFHPVAVGSEQQGNQQHHY